MLIQSQSSAITEEQPNIVPKKHSIFDDTDDVFPVSINFDVIVKKLIPIYFIE